MLQRAIRRLASLLLILPLAACKWGTAPTAEIDTRLAAAPSIPYSKADTCDTQRAIEAYHSWRDTQLKGKEIVYQPECVTKQTKPVPAAASTSKPVS